MNYQDELSFAKQLAEEAGDIMRQYFRSDDIGTTFKGDNSPLTQADTKINNLVVQVVKEHYPSHAVLGEEESHEIDSEFVWVCDPIDGTFPYSHGMPFSTFNLALVKDGQVVVSVINDPFCDRLFHAVRGQGVYLNDERLSDINGKRINGWLPINVEIWGGQTSSVFSDISMQAKIWEKIDQGDVMPLYLCSVAYSAALLAVGDMAGVLFAGKYPWDLAAASLIVEEAGGVVTDIDGKPIESFAQHINGGVLGTKETHKLIFERCGETLRKAGRT